MSNTYETRRRPEPREFWDQSIHTWKVTSYHGGEDCLYLEGKAKTVLDAFQKVLGYTSSNWASKEYPDGTAVMWRGQEKNLFLFHIVEVRLEKWA